jgi:cysteine-S-conjugate beta-lyase
MRYETSIVHSGADRDPHTGALSMPIYSASTYHQPDISTRQEFDYSRSGNPTRKALETALAQLESGAAGFAFSSGMAAITSAIMAVCRSGDHIVAARDIYGGTYRLLTSFFDRFGIGCTFADTTNLAAVEKAITPATRVLFLETPSNPLLKITDLDACATIARRHGLVSMADNTFCSPYFLRPCELGIDLCIHSATKFLGGHSDLLAGAVIARTDDLAKKVYFVQNTCGAVLSPENSWLLLRSIKTLAPRLRMQAETADSLAKWLANQPWVSAVYYPGLPEHPGHDIMKKQAYGFGAVASLKTDTVDRALSIMKTVKLWTVAVSLGGVESILSYPYKMSHAAIPADERNALGVTDTLVRLSPGLEAAEDLIDDLDRSAAS